MSELRKSRAQETRAALSVEDKYKEIFGSEQILDTSHIPPLEGMEQRWVRARLLNQDDVDNIARAMNSGKWEIRPYDSVEKGVFVQKGQDINGVQTIIKQGMILMHRPKYFGDVEREYHARQTRQQLMGVEFNEFADTGHFKSESYSSETRRGRIALADD